MQSLFLHLADKHETLMWNAQNLVVVALFFPSLPLVLLPPMESEMQLSPFENASHQPGWNFAYRPWHPTKRDFMRTAPRWSQRNFDQSMWMTAEWRHSVNMSYFSTWQILFECIRKFDRLLCSPPHVHPPPYLRRDSTRYPDPLGLQGSPSLRWGNSYCKVSQWADHGNKGSTASSLMHGCTLGWDSPAELKGTKSWKVK